MYNVVLSRDAAKALEKATPTMRRRLFSAFERLKAKPHSGKKLGGELEGLFSLRIGGMRAVYEVDADKKVVVILPLDSGATSTRNNPLVFWGNNT